MVGFHSKSLCFSGSVYAGRFSKSACAGRFTASGVCKYYEHFRGFTFGVWLQVALSGRVERPLVMNSAVLLLRALVQVIALSTVYIMVTNDNNMRSKLSGVQQHCTTLIKQKHQHYLPFILLKQKQKNDIKTQKISVRCYDKLRANRTRRYSLSLSLIPKTRRIARGHVPGHSSTQN